MHVCLKVNVRKGDTKSPSMIITNVKNAQILNNKIHRHTMNKNFVEKQCMKGTRTQWCKSLRITKSCVLSKKEGEK